MSTLEALAVRQMSEKEFMECHLIGTEKHPGLLPLAGFQLIYHTHDSRRSPIGFPDIVAVRDRDGVHTVIVAEVKRETGKPTIAQMQWLAHFGAIAAAVNPRTWQVRMIVGLWRPSDAERIWTEIQ